MSAPGRIAAIAAVVLAILLVAFLLFRTSNDAYTAKAKFINAGQLVKGNPVQTGGVPIGSVKEIEITDDGQAVIEFEIEEKHAPLHEGTHATIRQFSQSGIANRYIDLTMPPNGAKELDEGSTIDTEDTTTQVDLDELFNTLDEPTREALQNFFKGGREQWKGQGERGNTGLRFLNPALSTSSRLFDELNEDTPTLERFLVDSSQLVTALAERRDDLAGLIGNLNETTRALGNQKEALAESIELLPPFMRRANTTFVNLRSALDDVDPLVEASKPVAKRLGPFLTQARAFAADAEPTVRDLRVTIRKPGDSNDSIELLQSVPPLADIALNTEERTVAPGGRNVNVGVTRGSFPTSADALSATANTLRFSRPYTADLVGWFDDFSTTGVGFDALGLIARAQLNFFETFGFEQDGTPVLNGGPVRRGQYRRCPGGAEPPAADGSNVLSAEEQRISACDDSHRATGP